MKRFILLSLTVLLMSALIAAPSQTGSVIEKEKTYVDYGYYLLDVEIVKEAAKPLDGSGLFDRPNYEVLFKEVCFDLKTVGFDNLEYPKRGADYRRTQFYLIKSHRFARDGINYGLKSTSWKA